MSVVGRLCHIALYRPGVQHPTKDLQREAHTNMKGTLGRAERLVRYLIGRPKVQWRFPRSVRRGQAQAVFADALADSDWASKDTERKGTRCVVLRVGQCTLETSSTTQGVIAVVGRSRVLRCHTCRSLRCSADAVLPRSHLSRCSTSLERQRGSTRDDGWTGIGTS